MRAIRAFRGGSNSRAGPEGAQRRPRSEGALCIGLVGLVGNVAQHTFEVEIHRHELKIGCHFAFGQED